MRDNSIQLRVDGNRVFATSVEVARRFGKLHKDVLKALENLEIPEDFNRRNFALISYTDRMGRSQRAYEMTRDGFVLLVMGFTGVDAMQWKIKYLEAFNEMERQIRDGKISIGRDEARLLALLVRERAYHLGGVDGWRRRESLIHAAVQRRFGVGSYRELCASRYAEVQAFVRQWTPGGHGLPLLDAGGALQITANVGPAGFEAVKAALARGDMKSLSLTVAP